MVERRIAQISKELGIRSGPIVLSVGRSNPRAERKFWLIRRRRACVRGTRHGRRASRCAAKSPARPTVPVFDDRQHSCVNKCQTSHDEPEDAASLPGPMLLHRMIRARGGGSSPNSWGRQRIELLIGRRNRKPLGMQKVKPSSRRAHGLFIIWSLWPDICAIRLIISIPQCIASHYFILLCD